MPQSVPASQVLRVVGVLLHAIDDKKPPFEGDPELTEALGKLEEATANFARIVARKELGKG